MEPEATGSNPVGRTSTLLLFMLVALLLVPSANLAVFSGIPLASGAEFLAALLLAPVVLSASVRGSWGKLLGRAGVWPPRVLTLAAALALVAKVTLVASGVHTGFLACYRSLADTSASPSVATPVRGCEHSYDDPVSQSGVTRIDQTIDFGHGGQLGDSSGVRTSQWKLDFFNSVRFNFYAGARSTPNPNFLPFSVRWTGATSAREPHGVVVQYVGEGRIRVANRQIVLPASYRAASRRSVV